MFYFFRLLKNIFLKKNINLPEEPNLLFWTEDDPYFHTSSYCGELNRSSAILKSSTDICLKKSLCCSCKYRDSLK